MENETIARIKLVLITTCTMLWQWLGVLVLPVLLLLICQLLDYFTAIKAAAYRNQTVDSAKSIHGITKKVFMLLLVGAGLLIDILLVFTTDYIGLGNPFKFLISCILAVWLCINEIISILENINDVLGDDMPSFLLPLVKNIKSQVDKKVEVSGNPTQEEK